IAVSSLAAKVLAEHVVGHREQIGAKAGLSAKVILGLHAGQEGPLDEIVDPVIHLVAKEAGNGVEVPLEQRLSGLAISRPPRFQELEVRGHTRNLAKPVSPR